jgi:hypothetical protein
MNGKQFTWEKIAALEDRLRPKCDLDRLIAELILT